MGRYYYAGGKRVSIEEDEAHVAIDRARADAAGLEYAPPSGGSRLPGGVVVAEREQVGEPQLSKLRAAGALRPVYRHREARIVALPEIRVEVDGARQRRAVLESIARAPHPVVIAEDAADRIVLRPSSGSGDDAIDVANYVFEEAHPAAASVRLVQFVPKPVPRPRR